MSQIVRQSEPLLQAECAEVNGYPQFSGEGLPKFLSSAIVLSITFLVLGSPVFFGLVHETAFFPVTGLIFVLFCCFLATRSQVIFNCLASSKSARLTAFGLVLFLTFVVTQVQVFGLISYPHPVLGQTSKLANSYSANLGVTFVACFIALYLLTRSYLSVSPTFASTLLRLLEFAGLIVSLVALSHWYYDNGKLFWIFEPNSVFVSDRARWPFVNSNHLGSFLLFPFFVSLSQLLVVFCHLQPTNSVGPNARSNAGAISLISKGRVQIKILRTIFSLTCLLACAITIIATMSRGTWAGLLVGTLVLLLGFRRILPSQAGRPEIRFRRHSRRGRPGTSLDLKQYIKHVRAWAKPLLGVAIVCLVLFFLNEHGRELLMNRLEFGLMYSKDDIRWQMYSDSIALLKEHPFFGIGLKSWASDYYRVMNPALAGMNPVYMHSDPFQLLVEMGIFGIIPIVGLFIYYCLMLKSLLEPSPQREQQQCRIIALGLISSLIAVGIGSFFDFPFRIPTIAFYFSIVLATVSFYGDKRSID